MTKIVNLNKIICLIKNYGDSDCRIPKNLFLDEIIKRPIIGEGNSLSSVYRKHVETCKELDFVSEENENYVLTDDGKKYYEKIPIENKHKTVDKKTEEIKAMIVNKIVKSTTSFKKQMGNVNVDIKMKDGNAYFLVSNKEMKKINKRFLKLLKDLGLINNNNDEIQVSEKIIKNFTKRKIKSVSEKELYKILEKQRKVGFEAEKETISFEKNRLRDLGVREIIVDKIKRVSEEKTDAGYDIASFDGQKISLVFDRFIEVKATTGSYPIFYWSENEIENAKAKGEQYFIYLWINFGKLNQRLLTPIKNPYEKVWANDLIEKHAITTWRVIWNEEI